MWLCDISSGNSGNGCDNSSNDSYCGGSGSGKMLVLVVIVVILVFDTGVYNKRLIELDFKASAFGWTFNSLFLSDYEFYEN